MDSDLIKVNKIIDEEKENNLFVINQNNRLETYTKDLENIKNLPE